MLVTHWLNNRLTDWLTDCCLVNLIDVTLACEDANSKLVEVVTDDAEKRIDNSWVQIWKLKFGHRVKFLFWATEEGLVGSCSRQPTNLVYKSVSRLTLLWLPQPVRASQVPFHLLNCPPLPPPSPTTTTTHWNTFQTLHKGYKYSKKNVNKTTRTLSSWCIIWTIDELTSFTLKLTSPTPHPQ